MLCTYIFTTKKQCICIRTCYFYTICFVHNNTVHQKPLSPGSIYNSQSTVIYLHIIGGIAKVNKLHTNHTCLYKAKHKIINKIKPTITLYMLKYIRDDTYCKHNFRKEKGFCYVDFWKAFQSLKGLLCNIIDYVHISYIIFDQLSSTK